MAPLTRAEPGPRRIAVACSGGRDSIALLHVTARAAQALGVEVVALHVHHGLLPAADAWLAHLRAQCARWARAGLPLRLDFTRITERPAPGDSVEAWARTVRYRALADMARAAGCDAVLVAHHRRDQAETFLLQALRGAGAAGLAAMPAETRRDGVRWLRPWLQQPREAIEAYVRHHRLRHVDDDSNSDARLARNRLRAAVWPALTEAFPQAEQVLADAAARAAEAKDLLDEVAAADLAVVARGAVLDLPRWRVFSPARRSNMLRAWLRRQAGGPAPASLVARLLADLAPGATPGQAPARGGRAWPFGSVMVREHRGELQVVAAAEAPAPASAIDPTPMPIRRAGRYRLPGGHGTLVVQRVAEGGVPLAWLAQAEWRARAGGERFQAGIGRPPRSLKRQYQAAGIPAWQRDGPLLYSGGQLVFVPGLGLDARVIGLPGQALVSLRWQPRAGP